MKFSIGYNNDLDILSLLEKYQSYIDAFYFPAPYQLSPSGRSGLDKSTKKNIPKIIKKCNDLDISSQLLFNATCTGKDSLTKSYINNIIDYILKLQDLGLKSVVVTNPVYIMEIRRRVEGIRIEASVNCYVKTIEHAVFLKSLGVDVLTIDRDINRDIPFVF